jgi:hypothetical protein
MEAVTLKPSYHGVRSHVVERREGRPPRHAKSHHRERAAGRR